ncbi:MAG: transglycosylase domain-containing protein, partial [Acidimicrobiales bacterium]
MVYLTRLLRFIFVMAALIAVMAASLALVGPRIGDLVSAHRSDHERLALSRLAERSYIYDRNGNKMATLINSDNQNRVQVSIKDVPNTVRGAVLASEDVNFYQHSGVNVRSIGRAASANLEAGGVSQGGSTITQQVVKNSITGSKQNLSRKLHEAFLAVELEKQMSKDEILERYLNSVYFGGGAYGVAAASEYYFNKDVKVLDWSEAAMLAALIRSPNAYDPFRNPKLATKRRGVVFGRLMDTTWKALGPGRAAKAGHSPSDPLLTPAEVSLFDQVPVPMVPTQPRPPDDYFVERVKQQLLDDPSFNLGATPAARNQTVFSGGIRVYTTFDPALQIKATAARNATLPNNNGDGTFNVVNPQNGQLTYGTQAISSIEPSTGAVRVLVGGPGYKRDKSQADLTGLPGRPPGSSMKVFTLAALLENGFVPSDTVSGRGCTFKVPGGPVAKRVKGNTGTGTITTMIQLSSNCGFLRLAQVVGNDKIVDIAHRLGVRSPLTISNTQGPPLNLTLGPEDVAPVDMAAAYSVFANDGIRNPMYFVERIEDGKGKVIYQHQARPERVVSVQTARLIDEVLVNNVQRGTGRNARLPNGQPAAGKTGTTNESSNVWFVGFTPQLATSIWMGAPAGNISLANAGLEGATGGRFPALTWAAYYASILAGQPIVDFPAPFPTRPGQSVGPIPNEVGGSGRSGTSPGISTGTTSRGPAGRGTASIDFGSTGTQPPRSPGANTGTTIPVPGPAVPGPTVPPVTTPPGTTPPVTTPPVTIPPVTIPPVTTPPVTTPPVTAPPVTAPPVTAPPVTAPPV